MRLLLWCGCALLLSLLIICQSPLAGAVELDDDVMDLDTDPLLRKDDEDQPKSDVSKAAADADVVRDVDSILDNRAETPAAKAVQEDDTLTIGIWEEVDEATAEEELKKQKQSLSSSATITTADEAPPVTVDTKQTNDDKASLSATAAAADFDDDAAALTTTTTPSTTTSSSIPIRPELVGLTNDQLAAVCLERGFEIRRGDGVALTRDDLLQAASRCVQLEQELNDVLDDLPPELAVELESEIERMKSEKERLELEQARMLQEKDSLERQLREAGLDVPETSTTTPWTAITSSTRGGAVADTPETLEDVLRTSFTMLFDRVGRDMNLIGKVVTYVAIKPGIAALMVLWRYLGPTVEGLVERVLVVVDQVLATEYVVTVRRQVIEPLVETMLPVARPLVKQAISIVKMGLIQLDTIEPVHKCAVIAGAVLGPLRNSLLIGWRHSFQPKLMIARRKSAAWWKRIRTETRAKQQQQQQQQQ
jgi:hypothetical protein